jgi:hypothetical protein
VPRLTMRRWLPCLSLAALFISSDITAADARRPAKGAVHTVTIEDMQYAKSGEYAYGCS